MNKFKVIAPKGVSIGGVAHKKGDTFDAENKSAHVQTALHFKQIEEVKAKAEDPEAAAKAKADKEKADADLKAKEEAEAKAKAEAAAKGGK